MIIRNGKILHACSPRKITNGYLKVLKEGDELEEKDLPNCKYCNKKLELGDYIDHFFPYHSEESYCKECINEKISLE